MSRAGRLHPARAKRPGVITSADACRGGRAYGGGMTVTTTDPPRVEPARIAPARAMVRGVLVGAVCGAVGGPAAVVVFALFSLVFGGAAAIFFAFYALIPAAVVGGIVGAAVGLAGSAATVVALVLAERPPGVTPRSRRTAASVGAALGAAAAIVVVVLLLATVPPTVALVVAPITAVVAARIASRSIDALVVKPDETARERWSWRVLLAGFVVGVSALLLALVVALDPCWWSWGEDPVGPGPVSALVALIVVASVAGLLLIAGVCVAVDRATVAVAAALVLVATLFVVGALGVAGLTPQPERPDRSYPPPSASEPVEPADPESSPSAVAPVAPMPPLEASTQFTAADVVAASQAQVDATIAVVGPIDDPAIQAGTTTFPVGMGGCDNLAGGRVTFEVWFLVDDLAGGFTRARDAWVAAGFVLDETNADGRVTVTGTPGSAIDRMALENKEGTVKFTVQSVCVAGEDY